MALPLARPGDNAPAPAEPPTAPERERTPGDTAQPLLDETQQQAAIQDEQAAVDSAIQAAIQDHLQNRVVALNMEVRIRDGMIADLRQEVADLRAQLLDTQPQAEEGGSGGPTQDGAPSEHVPSA